MTELNKDQNNHFIDKVCDRFLGAKGKETLIQFLKFGIVGFINTVLSYAITNIGFYLLDLHMQLSNAISFVITVLISFLLNSRFVFSKEENKQGSFWKSLIRVYISYSITGLFLAGILLYVEETLLGIPHYIASFMNIIITVPLNFILNKYWAYRKK